MENQFERTELLLGKDAIQKLKNAHVAVFGVGGVGGFVVEALVRSGVGEIDVIDELQSVLDSSFSKNFPVELLSIICQQRKVRRCILSSTQNFPRLAKQLREQTNFIYRPLTLFGCLTIVRVYKAKLDENANFIDKDNKPIKIFFFVHDEDLRNSYDSYKTVDLIKVSKDKKSKGVA